MKKYVIVNDELKLRRLVKKLSTLEEFAFDTETNSLEAQGPSDSFRVVAISISWGDTENYYIPVGHTREEDVDYQLDAKTVADALRPIFERSDLRLIAHNMKFDMHVMKRFGISIKTRDLFDTMIASWLCDENSPNGLKECSMHLLRVAQTHFAEVRDTVPKEVKKAYGLKANSKPTFDMVLIKDAAPYALADSFYTWKLYEGFLDLLEKEGMEEIYEQTYKPFIRTMFDMEEAGVDVNLKELEQMGKSMQKDKEILMYKMFRLSGIEFNPGSSQQLCALLFGYKAPPKKNKKGELPDPNKKKTAAAENVEKLIAMNFGFRVLSTTDSGAPSTDGDTLWRLARLKFEKNQRKKKGVELCKLLSEYKKIDKLHSAFIEGLKDKLYSDGKAHPSFNIIGTDSGRLSCSSPNLQQLPKAGEEDVYQIRRLFRGSIDPKTGKRKKIIALDFANLEMRILAHFSKDKNLLKMFANGEDTHGSTAVNMFNLKCDPAEVKKQFPHLRQAAKIINFLLMYGGGAMRLFEQLRSDHDSPIDLGDKEYLKLYGVRKGEEVAQIYIDKYFSTYAGVAQFIRGQKREAKRKGYVTTILGRKRRLPDINGTNFKKVSYCERLAVNSTIQGSAADLTMSAQNRIAADPWFRKHRAIMLLQIHDELVFECPEEYVEECIRRAKMYMEDAFNGRVKMNLAMRADSDFGDTYQDAK
jgi:DNA polymerase-1